MKLPDEVARWSYFKSTDPIEIHSKILHFRIICRTSCWLSETGRIVQTLSNFLTAPKFLSLALEICTTNPVAVSSADIQPLKVSNSWTADLSAQYPSQHLLNMKKHLFHFLQNQFHIVFRLHTVWPHNCFIHEKNSSSDSWQWHGLSSTCSWLPTDFQLTC